MPLTWTPQMENEFLVLLRSDPSPIQQRIENARGVLSSKWNAPISWDAARHKYRRLKEKGLLDGGVPEVAPIPEAEPAPLYTGAWELEEGDGWAIYGDDHGAHVDFALFGRMCDEARRLGITQLLNGGDKWHADSFSKHAKIMPPVPFSTEKKVQRRLRAVAEATFKAEYILSGNHDKWIPKQMDGRLDPSDLEETFLGWLGANGCDVHWSVYGYCTIKIPTLGIVRVTHPRNYSRISANVAGKLAEKYGTHVLTFHEHGFGAKLVHTTKGDKWGIAVGCMADPRGFSYAMLEDSTSPAMRQGFALLKDGVFHLFDGTGYITSVGAAKQER